MSRVTRTQVRSDVMTLLANHFSSPRTLMDGSNASYHFVPENQGKGTIKIRPSSIVTEGDVEDTIPIIAIATDRGTDQLLGFNDGEFLYDPEEAESWKVKLTTIPTYINIVAKNEVQSSDIAEYISDIWPTLKIPLIEKEGYYDAVFQSPGVATIIRYVGPQNVIWSTPIVGYVQVIKAYAERKKASTLTQVSAYINGDLVWNGGPSDE